MSNQCPHGYPLVQQRHCQNCREIELERRVAELERIIEDARRDAANGCGVGVLLLTLNRAKRQEGE